MKSPVLAALVTIVVGCGSNSPPEHAGAAGAGGTSAVGGAAGTSAGGPSLGGGVGGAAGSGGGSVAGTGGSGAGAGGAGGAAAGSGGTAGSGGAAAGAGAGAAGSAGAATAACAVPATVDAQPMLLSQTGCVNPTKPTEAAASLIAYEVNSPLWSDGAAKERYISLPAGTKIHVNCTDAASCTPADTDTTGEDEGHWDMPVGTVLMKVFSVGGKRIETRLLMRRTDTTWQGYSYEWSDDESDATLLPDLKDKQVGTQTWHYPSRSQCLECHTKAGGRSLGPTTAQMNRDHDYADGTANQLDKFEALGLFDKAPVRIAAYPDPAGTADLEPRARSYLQANCSICHRPGGPVSDVDLRFVTSFKDTTLCNQMVNMATGDPNVPQIRLTPGDPSKSCLSFRMHDTTTYRMPKIGSNVVDSTGTALIDAWITSITSCP